jgi:sortase A
VRPDNVIDMPGTARRARFGSRSAWGRRLGRTLIVIGILMVLYWGTGFGLGIWRQADDEARWDRLGSTAAAGGPPGAALARPVDGMDFKLVVPRLGYDAVVREGVGLDVLASGPGHYPGSAWPGEAGVVGIAAHNVRWIRFDQLRVGDRVVVQTRYGAFDYRITGSRVVGPDDTSVLRPESNRRLTLTTCWPLWAGELARERLAIFADDAPAI